MAAIAPITPNPAAAAESRLRKNIASPDKIFATIHSKLTTALSTSATGKAAVSVEFKMLRLESANDEMRKILTPGANERLAEAFKILVSEALPKSWIEATVAMDTGGYQPELKRIVKIRILG